MTSMTPPGATLMLVVTVPHRPHHPQQADTQGGAPTADGLMALVLLAAVFIVAYRISVTLHPFTKCRTCRGSGKHFGAVFKSAHRPCDDCRGSGRQPRRGSRAQ